MRYIKSLLEQYKAIFSCKDLMHAKQGGSPLPVLDTGLIFLPTCAGQDTKRNQCYQGN
jgi:hypothetical protein